MDDPTREWCDRNGVELDDDGIPVRDPGDPGLPRPCLRCGGLTECQGDTLGYTNGRNLNGPLCEDCYRLLTTDSSAFFAGLK